MNTQTNQINVLVNCEESATVREAFRELGFNAWSCDILPSRIPGNHLQMDAFEAIKAMKWHLMIAFPPCTFLTVSANRWYKDQPKPKSGVLVGEERRAARREAIAFFLKLMDSDIPHIAIENPIGIMSTIYGKPQIIQPWMFGHPETKATCLWRKNLPELEETDNVKELMEGLPANVAHRIHYMAPGEDRQRERSTTFPGVAKAMAVQWGRYIQIRGIK